MSQLRAWSVFALLSLATVSVTACRTPSPEAGSETLGDEGANEPGGVISIILLPPAVPLDWSTPNRLTVTSVQSKAKGELLRKLKQIKAAHPIGHVMVEMNCPNVQIPLTGQTGGGSEYATLLDGLGASFRTWPGALDVTENVRPDIETRQKTGRIAYMNFRITGKMCRHLAGFLDEYKKHGAEKNYGGQFRPRRWEGAGCSAFGLAFVEVGGLLKRSQYTPEWSRVVNVGIGRVTDVFGDGTYAYGSNLQMRGPDGTLVQWPKDLPITVLKEPIRPGSPWLQAWADAEDAGVNPLPNDQPNQIPWTIYDPAAIYNFIDAVWSNGGGQGMGRAWEVKTIGKAHVIETDATDAVARPYEDPEDDLLKD